MIKFAKIIIDRKNNEYRNLHFLPEVFSLKLLLMVMLLEIIEVARASLRIT